MTHRLLHTLVFSSLTVLEGCGVAHVALTPDAGALTPDAGALTPDAGALTPDAPDAFAGPDAFAHPDAFDPRWCEPGWPTTKGQTRVEHEGAVYGCTWEAVREDGSVDLERCCLVRPEDLP